jgi:hypothetical protein
MGHVGKNFGIPVEQFTEEVRLFPLDMLSGFDTSATDS